MRTDGQHNSPLNGQHKSQFTVQLGDYVSFDDEKTARKASPCAPMKMDSFNSSRSFTSDRNEYASNRRDSSLQLYDTEHGPPSASFLLPSQSSPLNPKSTKFGWWNPMWLMYGFFTIGIGGAVGHHAFYASLDGTEAREQLRMLRYGAALSYVAKAFLMASVVLAFRQQIWATVRRKLLSVGAIDSLFAVIEDPFAMLNLEVFKSAKIAMFLALVVWTSPLTVILTPGTLTVESAELVNATMCPSVRTLNFSPEANTQWRDMPKVNGFNELSLSWFNSTTSGNKPLDGNDPQNSFDYYTSPSQQVVSIATLSTYLQAPVGRTNASIEVCGSGWNCTFQITFDGPGYKCSDVLESEKDAPFNKSVLLPSGTSSYVAHASLGEYASVQLESGIGGIPLQPAPYPADFGAFRTEPIIWIGHSVIKDPSQPFPQNSSDPNWDTAFEPKILKCEHYETKYTVQINYTSAVQFTNVTHEYIKPIVDTQLVPGLAANDGTRDNTTATPAENYVFPNKDVKNYRLVSAYHSLGVQLRKSINGTIDFNAAGLQITNTDATNTKIIDMEHYLPVPDLMGALQSLYDDIILSLLSNPQFLVVAWAADPSTPSGKRTDGPLHPCTRTRIRNIFVYRKRVLWIVYGIFISLATISIIFGALAIAKNEGHFRRSRFSSIVGASRGAQLDHLDWRVDKRGHVPGSVRRTKLQYGQATHGTGTRRDLGEIFHKSDN